MRDRENARHQIFQETPASVAGDYHPLPRRMAASVNGY